MKIAILHQRYDRFGGGTAILDNIVGCYAESSSDEVTLIVRRWAGRAHGRIAVRRVDPPYLGATLRDWGFAASMTPARLAGYDLVMSDHKITGIDVHFAGGGVHRAFLRSQAEFRPWWRRLWSRIDLHDAYTLWAERRLYASPRLRAVVCVSERVRRDIRADYGVPAHKLHVIPNGIDASAFDPAWRLAERARLRAEHGLGEAFTLLFVGSGMRNKGLVPILHALAQARPDTRLLIVGKERRQREFERLARRLGVAERCRFAGPQGDVRPWYAMADALILASYYETFGLVVLEAMAMGLPVLVSRRAGAAELIEEGRHGYTIDPADVPGMVRAVERLRERAAGMSADCIALARRCTTARMVEAIDRLFRQLVAAPRGA